MRAHLSDGRVLDFPDGTDPEIVKATVKRLVSKPAPVIPESKIPAIQASREGGFMRGMRDPVEGLSQVLQEGGITQPKSEFLTAEQKIQLQNKLPSESDVIKKEEQYYQQGRENRGESGFDGSRMAGNLLSPVSLGLMAVPGGQATLPARMATGGAAGVVGAGTQPVTGDDFASEKLNQAVWGLAFGSAIPAAISGVGKIKSAGSEFLKPFSDKGIKADVAKYMRNLAGEDRARIARALSMSEGDETAQQALGRIFRESIEEGNPKALGGRIARFEDELAKSKYTGGAIQSHKAMQAKGRMDKMSDLAGDTAGEVSIPTKANMLRNQHTMTGQTDDIAGKQIDNIDDEIKRLFPDEDGIIDDITADTVQTGTKFKVAEANKRISAERNYNEAWKLPVEVDDELIGLLENPYLKDAVPAAHKLAKAEGITFESNPTKFLHFIKIGLDANLKKVGDTALVGAEKKAAKSIQGKLVDWIGKNNKAYDFARKENIRLSKPIDQMKVGQVLKEGLETPATKEAPLPFLRAMKDAPKTLKKATGFNGNQNIDDVLNPSQMNAVDKVRESLINQQKGKELASGKVGSLGDLSSEIEVSLPNLLSRPVMAANFILKQVGKDKSPEYQKVAEALILQPKDLAKALDLPPENMKRKIAEEIMRKSAIISSSQEMGRGVNQ